MPGLDDSDLDDDAGTVFRDVVTLALAGFVSVVILMLPHLNPPAGKTEAETASPGNVIVEIRWPDHMGHDVDLWVQAPGDVPVGYSNKGGLIFNLLRDDLGYLADPLNINYENAYSRGIPPGEYTVNVHLYRGSGGEPVPVTIAVRSKADVNDSVRDLLTTKVTLKREGEEITAFRFRLDAKGRIEPGTVHSLYKPLRAANKNQGGR